MDAGDRLESARCRGYNAALLCHRLGSGRVFALDIAAELIGLARERLARLGHHPTLVVTDGAHGLPEHAPYDRIIATCSVAAIPWAWVAQTRHDGMILADVKIGKQAGNLVLLRRNGPLAEGRFDPTYGSFMRIRRPGGTYPQPRPSGAARPRDSARQRSTTLDLTRPWEHAAFWFYAHTALPAGTSFSLRGDGPDQPPCNTILHAPDGSWCEIRDQSENGTHLLWEAGPTPLWRIVEDAHQAWTTLGRPSWQRFGLTVTPDRQWIWLDSPHSGHSWPLGMSGSFP